MLIHGSLWVQLNFRNCSTKIFCSQGKYPFQFYQLCSWQDLVLYAPFSSELEVSTALLYFHFSVFSGLVFLRFYYAPVTGNSHPPPWGNMGHEWGFHSLPCPRGWGFIHFSPLTFLMGGMGD